MASSSIKVKVPAGPFKQTTGTTCPICTHRTLGRCCKDVECGWTTCKTKTCDARFDLRRGLGHCINPSPTPHLHPVTKAVLRLRVILVGGEWVDRDAD